MIKKLWHEDKDTVEMIGGGEWRSPLGREEVVLNLLEDIYRLKEDLQDSCQMYEDRIESNVNYIHELENTIH